MKTSGCSGTKIHTNDLGNKVGSQPRYGKNFKHLNLQNQLSDSIEHSALESYQDYTNGNLWLTLTSFMARSKYRKMLEHMISLKVLRILAANWYRQFSK